MFTHVACDLDGVLIDSHEALRLAYAQAGASNWKPNTPWKMFATEHQHEIKNRLYEGCLRSHGRLFPLARVADELEWDIVTGASDQAVSLVRNVFNLNLRFCYANVKSIEERVELLKGLGTSVYIDDCEENLKVIRREIPRCQTFLTRP
jgi:hypothetical protein